MACFINSSAPGAQPSAFAFEPKGFSPVIAEEAGPGPQGWCTARAGGAVLPLRALLGSGLLRGSRLGLSPSVCGVGHGLDCGMPCPVGAQGGGSWRALARRWGPSTTLKGLGCDLPFKPHFSVGFLQKF